MEKDFLDVLQEITIKQPYELTEYEQTFIRARKDYLNSEELIIFKDILNSVIVTRDEVNEIKKERFTIEQRKAIGERLRLARLNKKMEGGGENAL